jgi:hypothetical protein
MGNVSENPTVTRGTSPVMEVRKQVLTTRGNTVCLMALMVGTSAGGGGGPTATRYRNIT